MLKITEFVSPKIAQDLEKELLNLVGTEVKKADTTLFERKTLNFRDIIDNSFPSMLVVDYNNIRSELKQYQDIETSLKTLIDRETKITERDVSINKFSNEEVELILKAIKIGINKFTAQSAINTTSSKLNKDLNDIVSSDNTNTILSRVKTLFSKIYKLTDVSTSNTEVFIFPNFAILSGTRLRQSLEAGLTIAEFEAGREVQGLDSIGKLLAYGHTAAGYIDEKGNARLNFNSPKSIAVMFDVLNSSSDKAAAKTKAAQDAVTFFVQDTRQAEVFLTLDREFSEGFLKTFVGIGGNIARFENSLINSRRGSVLETREKRGSNKATLQVLASLFTKTGNVVANRLARYIVNKKGSPNLLEYYVQSLKNTLTGKPTQSYTSSTSASNQTTDKLVKQVVAGLVKGKPKLPKLTKPRPRPQKPLVNLVNLQNLINRLLQDVISANMGDGDRRDILNYRTGRLAASAKVESISESRNGMITAFYSYMKNPYATFSEGGRQSVPKTRDPKLLISTSIREIAAEQVGNRLRAVAL
jgi:hypothetical protein